MNQKIIRNAELIKFQPGDATRYTAMISCFNAYTCMAVGSGDVPSICFNVPVDNFNNYLLNLFVTSEVDDFSAFAVDHHFISYLSPPVVEHNNFAKRWTMVVGLLMLAIHLWGDDKNDLSLIADVYHNRVDDAKLKLAVLLKNCESESETES